MNKIKEKLEKYGQEHVLKFWDELNEEDQADLAGQIMDTDFSVISDALSSDMTGGRGEISPIPALMTDEIEAKRDEYEAAGLAELRLCHVGALLLAGGMGTRLGSDNPKGMYNIGLTRDIYIFECLFNNLMKVTQKAGNAIHLFIMTSEKNDADTRDFLRNHNFFGYPSEYVHFFRQEMSAATDFDGKVYMESPGRMATSPNGNGGWYVSMIKSGLAQFAKKEGIKWLNVFGVDNVLVKIADPVFIGATIKEGKESGAKVIRKASRDEKVGVICNEDGRPSIIEYYEMTDQMLDQKDEKGDYAYSMGVILNYLFRMDILDEIVQNSMTYHLVKKQIAHIDDQGRLIKPDQPNGYKYENLIIDQIHFMKDCLIYEVIREKEFAPIKNKTGIDSVESARALLRQNGVNL